MSRTTALIIAGVVTAIALVLALGLAGGASLFNQPASAASADGVQTTAAGALCVNPSDVATLQGQLADYEAALQQANIQLQAAYNEIAALQGQGGFRGEHEGNERGGAFFNPFGND